MKNWEQRSKNEWIRKDHQFTVERQLLSMRSKREARYYARQNGMKIRNAKQRSVRTWPDAAAAMKSMDYLFPMAIEPLGATEEKQEPLILGNWYPGSYIRIDGKFRVKIKRRKPRGKFGYCVWGAPDRRKCLRFMETKSGNTRMWNSSNAAMKAMNKEYPMAKKPKSKKQPTKPKQITKCSVRMEFVFDCTAAEATKIIYEFATGKPLSKMDLRVEEFTGPPEAKS